MPRLGFEAVPLPKQGLERRRGLKPYAFRNDLRAAKRDFADALPKRARANGPKNRPALRMTPERRRMPKQVPKVIGKTNSFAAGRRVLHSGVPRCH